MSAFGGPNIIDNGLILYLDAGNRKSYTSGSTTWFDKSGFNNNGTLTNGPTFNTGSGGSIVFDGVDDYGIIPDSNILSFTNAQMTVSAWVNIISSIPTAVGNENIIINKANYTNGWREWSFFWYRDGYFELLMNPTANNGANWTRVGAGTGAFTNFNTWYHVTGTSNGLGTGKLYVNGDLRDTNNSYTTSTQNEQAPVTIGCSINGSTPVQLSNMKISLIQIYNRALSSDEVLQNYNATKGRFGL